MAGPAKGSRGTRSNVGWSAVASAPNRGASCSSSSFDGRSAGDPAATSASHSSGRHLASRGSSVTGGLPWNGNPRLGGGGGGASR